MPFSQGAWFCSTAPSVRAQPKWSGCSLPALISPGTNVFFLLTGPYYMPLPQTHSRDSQVGNPVILAVLQGTLQQLLVLADPGGSGILMLKVT